MKEKKVKYGIFVDIDDSSIVTSWYGDKGVIVYKKVKAWKNPQGYYIQHPYVQALIRLTCFFKYIMEKRGHIDI